jgi:hypothetical protein
VADVLWHLRESIPVLTEASEYAGQPAVRISATQLSPTRYSKRDAMRVVSDWIEFFERGPSGIRRLAFVSRTPKRLFQALASQTQMEWLSVKWGDYDDLGALSTLTRLTNLRLCGASSVRNLAPLAQLDQVEKLEVESLKHAHDLSPIGRMRSVVDLDIGGNWMTPRIAHVDSLAFLREMPQLRRLLLHTVIVDDLDYSPVLDLPNLEAVAVTKARGMHPPIEELMARTPWRS